MRLVAFIALVLLAVPALALDKPAVSPEAACCGCDSCYCDNECLCPVAIDVNGTRQVMRPVWKHPVAATLKRTAAAPFLFIFREPQRLWVPVAEVPSQVPADVVRNYRPLVVE